MNDGLRLLCAFAHPDDESLGAGGTLAKYADEGVETFLLTATRGERGWPDENRPYPGPEALGRIREAELRKAARVLNVSELIVLPYQDGRLDSADPEEAQRLICGHIRRLRPQVVVTFGPEGVYGHPDHIAISQMTTGAILRAADPAQAGEDPPHVVSKLYFIAETAEALQFYEQYASKLVIEVEGERRASTYWPEWAVTTRIDTRAYWRQAWEAIRCHQTQLPSFSALQDLPEDSHARLWASQSYYRALSLVNGGRGLEEDLFAGLR
jgi:LmbE family N-acetylglucosaminyl deacetylase